MESVQISIRNLVHFITTADCKSPCESLFMHHYTVGQTAGVMDFFPPHVLIF